MENSSYIKGKAQFEQELDRYGYIVDYFYNNPSRVSKNRGYLTNLIDSLKHIYSKNFKETSYIGAKTREFQKEIINLLEQDKKEDIKNLRTKLEDIEDSRKKAGKPI